MEETHNSVNKTIKRVKHLLGLFPERDDQFTSMTTGHGDTRRSEHSRIYCSERVRKCTSTNICVYPIYNDLYRGGVPQGCWASFNHYTEREMTFFTFVQNTLGWWLFCFISISLITFTIVDLQCFKSAQLGWALWTTHQRQMAQTTVIWMLHAQPQPNAVCVSIIFFCSTIFVQTRSAEDLFCLLI